MKTDPMQDDAMEEKEAFLEIFTFKRCAIYGYDTKSKDSIVIDFSVTHISSKEEVDQIKLCKELLYCTNICTVVIGEFWYPRVLNLLAAMPERCDCLNFGDIPLNLYFGGCNLLGVQIEGLWVKMP